MQEQDPAELSVSRRERGTAAEGLRPSAPGRAREDGRLVDSPVLDAERPESGAPFHGPDPEELRLVTALQAGEPQAFEELLDRYQRRVFRLVQKMATSHRESAEDLTQEVFLRVYRGLASFQLECSFWAWIQRITCNLCVSDLRKRKALKRDRLTLSLNAAPAGSDPDRAPMPDPVADVPQPSEQVARRELFGRCRAAIEALPELWRVILTLRDLEGRSYEEIGAVLELPIGTVRSRLHRARARVRDMLEGGSQ
ncbi:MAG: RNA polymerase sigma factor RpoE [Planctomycetota bacterium]|nr:MAG: RNA polymerase sigma factor RpoE [Planctomycetota bacterium]